ncbi:unnamed protein product [Durusdinium trenchii]|uniref:Uncharacterized protein n=1 Tax=Durusdinium trenchii TaxID=1381693 RepID=A0ABP0MM79_9DINO
MPLQQISALSDDEPMVGKPVVKGSNSKGQKFPKFGWKDPSSGKVHSFKPMCLPRAVPEKVRLVPKRVSKKATLKTKKIVGKTVRMKTWGTIRCFGATYRANTSYLSVRGRQDFGTQVFYWDKYRAELKKSVPKELRNKKKFVPPRVAEYFAGVPHKWTSLTEHVSKTAFEQLFGPLQGKQLEVISVFSGVAGLELGLRQFCKACVYVERDEFCQQVLRKRMAEGWIPRAERSTQTLFSITLALP